MGLRKICVLAREHDRAFPEILSALILPGVLVEALTHIVALTYVRE